MSGDQIMKSQAELRGEFNGLPDGLLGFIFVSVVVYNPRTPLNIGDYLPVRLNEIVSEQDGYATDIVAKSLEDNGIGDLDQALPVSPEKAPPGGPGSVNIHPSRRLVWA